MDDHDSKKIVLDNIKLFPVSEWMHRDLLEKVKREFYSEKTLIDLVANRLNATYFRMFKKGEIQNVNRTNNY